MKIAMVAAGFSGGEAEELRRAMGFKRAAEEMNPIEEKLRSGMTTNGIPETAQEEIVGSIRSFALYGFPESHSASFALIAYASAYLKAYHPAAFTCALLNSWPLGFYGPDTLLKDAKRHGVRVRPIDVAVSDWKCTLETKATLRLGLQFAQGLRHKAFTRIQKERSFKPFASLHDFERRCRLTNSELHTLAELGAFASIPSPQKGQGYTRREALWESASLKERTTGLLGCLPPPAAQSPLPEMTPAQRILADHRQSGMSVGTHVLGFIRADLNRHQIHAAASLGDLSNGATARVAGVVTVRQRPMTAKGFLFMTLEDETGFANLIIGPKIFERYRPLIISATGLWAEGSLQIREGVIQLKATHLAPLHNLPT